MWFVTSQSLANVDRALNNPTPLISADIEQVGPGVLRSLSRHQAMSFNRHVVDAWTYLQLGIVAALFAVAIFTSGRSRVLVPAVLVLLVLLCLETFLLTPSIRKLELTAEQAPALGALDAQKELLTALVYRRLLQVAKVSCGVLISLRLLWDWHNLAHGTYSRRRHTGKRRSRYADGLSDDRTDPASR
jgi:hypothetical protein